MSYFMTTTGIGVDFSDLSPAVLLPASEAQPYIIRIAEDLINIDGTPLFLVHDGYTGTSHNIVTDAESYIRKDGTITDSLFWRIATRLAQNNHTFRVWWPDDYLSAVSHSSIDLLFGTVKNQVLASQDICVKYSSL